MTLTVIGMGVVFLALTLLALAAWILERMFRVPEGLPEPGTPRTDTEQQTSEIEAVIAVALFHYARKRGFIHIERADESAWIQHTRVYT